MKTDSAKPMIAADKMTNDSAMRTAIEAKKTVNHETHGLILYSTLPLAPNAPN